MASSRYSESDVDSVKGLTAGQAAEVVKADVAYFGGTDVRQLGRTALAAVQVSDASSGTSARYRVDVVLDISRVSYTRDGPADVVTSRLGYGASAAGDVGHRRLPPGESDRISVGKFTHVTALGEPRNRGQADVSMRALVFRASRLRYRQVGNLEAMENPIGPRSPSNRGATRHRCRSLQVDLAQQARFEHVVLGCAAAPL